MRGNRDIMAMPRNRDVVRMTWNANAVRVIVDLMRMRGMDMRTRPYKGLIAINGFAVTGRREPRATRKTMIMHGLPTCLARQDV